MDLVCCSSIDCIALVGIALHGARWFEQAFTASEALMFMMRC